MSFALKMPAFSSSMEEGTIAKWLVPEGSEVARGDIIAEIETDKATMELEAARDGILAKIVVPAGEDPVSVDSVIAIMTASSEGSELPVEGGDRPSASAQGISSPETRETDKATRDNNTSRIFASPLAKRIAAEAKIDLGSLSGSGPRGRILLQDVEKAKGRQPAAMPVNEADVARDSVPPIESSLFAGGTYEVVKLGAMRKAIAQRLTESKQRIPHFYLRASIQLDAMLSLRAEINSDLAGKAADGVQPPRISVNDFMIKAHALALVDNPDANVTWADGNMLRHKVVDVAVAVAIEGGLLTPIVRSADRASLSAISGKVKDLARLARNRKLSPEDYQGGTTSISNLGMYGVESFDAVINPPHGTILAVGAGKRQPVVNGDELSVGTVVSVTLSADHRMVDGALAASLLASFQSYVENPMTLLV